MPSRSYSARRLTRPTTSLRRRVQTGECRRGEFIELTDAIIVAPQGLSRPEKKAVAMLVEEVESRTGCRWKVQATWPRENRQIVAVAAAPLLPPQATAASRRTRSGQTESGGIRIGTHAGERVAVIAGNDARGVLFGVGRFLRELRMTPGKVLVPGGMDARDALRDIRSAVINSAIDPRRIRTTAWDLPQWERYIRELAIFGANSVELIPPRSDDASDSPHFPRPPMEMLVGMSRLVR